MECKEMNSFASHRRASRVSHLPTSHAQEPLSSTSLHATSAFAVDPRTWTTYHLWQVFYFIYGIAQVVVATTVLWHVKPRGLAVTDVEFVQAPELLLAACGVVDLAIGSVGYRQHCELLSRGLSPIKTAKICIHMVIIVSSYSNITGCYQDASRGAVIASMVPLVISGLLFLVVHHLAMHATLLRTHQIRVASCLELIFPLIMSLALFASSQFALLMYLYIHAGNVSFLGELARGLFQVDALFVVLYASHALWLCSPHMFTNYKLEFMSELILVVMRFLFRASLST